jgi:hypothetical protein
MGCGEQYSVDESFAVTAAQCDSWYRYASMKSSAVTFVQSGGGSFSGPHPIRRHSPSNDGRFSTPYGATFPSRAAEGERATLKMREHNSKAATRIAMPLRPRDDDSA